MTKHEFQAISSRACSFFFACRNQMLTWLTLTSADKFFRLRGRSGVPMEEQRYNGTPDSSPWTWSPNSSQKITDKRMSLSVSSAPKIQEDTRTPHCRTSSFQLIHRRFDSESHSHLRHKCEVWNGLKNKNSRRNSHRECEMCRNKFTLLQRVNEIQRVSFQRNWSVVDNFAQRVLAITEHATRASEISQTPAN